MLRHIDPTSPSQMMDDAPRSHVPPADVSYGAPIRTSFGTREANPFLGHTTPPSPEVVAEIMETARREREELGDDSQHVIELRCRADELERTKAARESEIAAIDAEYLAAAHHATPDELAIIRARRTKPSNELAAANKELAELRARLGNEQYLERLREIDRRIAASREKHTAALRQIAGGAERAANEIRALIQFAEKLFAAERAEQTAALAELRELGALRPGGAWPKADHHDPAGVVRNELRRALEQTPLDVIIRR